jgi:hypothetical protein
LKEWKGQIGNLAKEQCRKDYKDLPSHLLSFMNNALQKVLNKIDIGPVGFCISLLGFEINRIAPVRLVQRNGKKAKKVG